MSSCWAPSVRREQTLDDDDDGALQAEATGLFPGGRDRGLLAPEMGRIADALSDSMLKRGNTVGKRDDLPQELTRIRSLSWLRGWIH